MTINIQRMFLLTIIFLFIIITVLGCSKSDVDTDTNQTDAPTPKQTDPPEEIDLPENPNFKIYCFAAGKADAFLLMSENGTVLIDAAEKSFGKEIVAYIDDAGIDHIDYLIITHFDKDHVGGAGKVIDTVPVSNVLQSNAPKDSGQYETYMSALVYAQIEPVTVSETYTFELDGILYVIDPPREESYAHSPSNNSSLVVSVTNGNNTFLFAGDVENDRIKEFLSDHSEHYDFLKVPYHGNWQKQLDDLINAVNPDYAVITSSNKEPEDKRTTEFLSAKGVKTFLTRSAAVLVQSDGEMISVQYSD